MACASGCLLFLGAVVVAAGGAGPVVSDLGAEYRNGQVFLTWKESAVPEDTTFNVYVSREPVSQGSLDRATCVCRRVGLRSAYDWWLNPETYGKPAKPDPNTGEKPPYPIRGFIIRDGGAPLDADSGLHVHTVAQGEEGQHWYAVTCVMNGKEDRTVVPGRNALARPVAQKREPVQPIWQGAPERVPAPGEGAGKPVLLMLHSKGSRRVRDYLAFGDASLGWREGLPFKFDVRLRPDRVDVAPNDRGWIGRMLKNARDGCNRLTPAIHSFWYGYSDKIYDPELVETGTPTNYTERRVLWILSWVRQHFTTDPNRTYCTGGSMGGCGGVDFAFRHPEIFAAVWANVPNFAYGEGDKEHGWRDNTYRLAAYCGQIDLKCSDGVTLRERLDARRFVRSHPGDLPFLAVSNGRNDGSMTWHYNPDFYRAMQEGRHGLIAAWNGGGHGDSLGKTAPDFREWSRFERLSRFALNKSHPAFSHCSKDGDPGNGDAADGDIVGYINRGLDWQDPVDEAKRYEVLIRWTLDAAQLPVTVDVTPRRVQAFRPNPGETCEAVNLDAAATEIQRATIVADANGLLTFVGFRITSRDGNRLVLQR